jgi:hypothetical protein
MTPDRLRGEDDDRKDCIGVTTGLSVSNTTRLEVCDDTGWRATDDGCTADASEHNFVDLAAEPPQGSDANTTTSNIGRTNALSNRDSSSFTSEDLMMRWRRRSANLSDREALTYRQVDLLHQVLPPRVADALLNNDDDQHMVPERFENVTIFHSDIVGFTNLASQLQAREVISSRRLIRHPHFSSCCC